MDTSQMMDAFQALLVQTQEQHKVEWWQEAEVTKKNTDAKDKKQRNDRKY